MEEVIIDIAKSISTHGWWGVAGSVILLGLVIYIKINKKRIARDSSDRRQAQNISNNRAENASASEDAQSAEEAIEDIINRSQK